ncbi:hypothetical protein EIP91_012426 [Steccherinum ochraceum]|uniref:Uncharacterized protein n=1 Tax=Steccherinum ochraceum TaxID=92696 RepID=A0A4R0RGK5_9APHY|nr:hypothetical protein EIP91_012426 [Steccherinum ochraceum]
MSQNAVAYPSTDLFPPAYSFLSHPPPQKPLPSQPLPPPPAYELENIPPSTIISGRRRSSIMISIAAWAENVPPGSPAPPRRKDSYADTSDCKAALKAAGYSSSIVNVQDIILPPTVPVRKSRYSLLPEPRSSQREIRRSNSQSSLKGSSRTRSRPSTATQADPHGSSSKEHRRDRSSSTIMKDKKSKKHPGTLERDLALAQFLDGGSSEGQVKKYVDARARMAGAPVVNGQYVGAGDVYRDAQGRVWRDSDEALERAHLLTGQANEKSWVGFASEDEIRRGSVSTAETLDSDLDPRYAVQPNDEEVARLGGAIPPRVHTNQSARHLHKPEALLDQFPAPTAVSWKERRRPPPLAFDAAQTSPSFIYSPGNPANQEAGRRDFIDSSFSPAPVTAKPVPSRTGSGSSDSKSKLGVKGILRAVGMKK